MELKLEHEDETAQNQPLLIVPYGIETCGNLLKRKAFPLLIVPYGIETYHLPALRK